MKALLQKIREILRNRKMRRLFTRVISIFGAVVVFTTTYALVLPAITMERQADCGIEAHQHDDSCYEDVLACGLEESENHHHDGSCYDRVLTCGKEVHVHSDACYHRDEDNGEVTAYAEEADDPDSTVRTDPTYAAISGDSEEGTSEDTISGEGIAEDGNSENGDSDDVNSNSTGDISGENRGDTDQADAGETGQAEYAPAGSTGPAAAVEPGEDETSMPEEQNGEGTGEEPDFRDGTLETTGPGYRIILDYKADAQIPENAYLSVSEITEESDPEAYEACLNEAGKTIPADDKTVVDDKASRFFDIEILVDGEADSAPRKIEPAAPVSVNIQLFDTEVSGNVDEYDAEQYKVIHFADEGTEEIPDVTAQTIDADQVPADVFNENTAESSAEVAPPTEVQFEAESFSIYGVVYTVDFHWQVNGKTYDFNIPGGGFASLEHLVEVLGITVSDENKENGAGTAENGPESGNDFAGADTSGEEGSAYEQAISLNEVEVSEASKKFVADVESAEFSTPELVWVGKADDTATIGELKDANGLEVQYSADLTEEQIAKINGEEVRSGDWVLISLKPFKTEETLTVTMKNGETFTIHVTDSQDSYGLDGQSYEIIVNGSKALSPVRETENIYGVNYQFLNNADPSSGSNLSWKFEYDHEAFGENNDGYYISHEGQYLKIVGDNSSDTNRTVTLVNTKEEATPVKVTFNKDKGKYSFSNNADANKGFLCHFNNDYFGVEGNASSDDAWFELRDPDHPEKPGLVSPWDVKSDNIRIKLFDYTGTVNNEDIDDCYGDKYWASTWLSGTGINNGRTLIFSGGGLDSQSNGEWNYYTGQSPAVMQGIVKNTLTGGYPELTNTTGNKGASLGYLFGAGGQDGVTTYAGSDGTGLKGLLRRDEDGYYYFSSEQNYATLVDPETGQIVNDELFIYSESYKKDNPSENAKKIGFFPFDPYRAGESKAGEEKGFNGSPYNHQFGMTLEADFALPPNGTLPNGEEMKFNFSGDDDVWVFIDDVLVLDLGGVHQPLSGEINFADGKSYVTDATIQSVPDQTTVGTGKTIKELFEAAGKVYDDSPYSTHTIKFYYLERGGCDSNCSLSFNLDVVKGKGSVDVAKYDKDANPVAPLKGVKFGLYSDPQCNNLMKEVTSDGSGLVSFKDLPVKTDDQVYYLKETKELAGYEKDETVYTLEAVKIETGKYKFLVKKNGEEIETIGQNPKYPVVYNEQVEPINLTVQKKWENPQGEQIAPPGDATATFKVQRYFRKEGDIVIPDTSQPVTFKVFRYKDYNTPVQVGDAYTFKGGTAVNVNWSYSNGYYDNNYRSIMHYKEEKNGIYTNNGNYLNKTDPVVINLPNSGYANIYIRDENVGHDHDWGPGVYNITVDGTPYEPEDTIQHISTEWAADTDFNNSNACPTLALPAEAIDAEHSWTGRFDNLVVSETKNDGLGYYYQYYVIETAKTPSEAETVYVDGNNNVISDPSTLKTDTNGSEQTITNRVPVGNLKVTKDLLGDVTGNEDKVFKVTIKNSANPAQYLQQDKKTFGSTPYEFSVSKSAELLIEGLPIGTYTVEEKTDDVAIAGFLWNVEESTASGTGTITANQTATVELKNYYDEIYTPEPSDMDVKEDLAINKTWVNLNNRQPSDTDEILVKVKVKSAEAYVPVKWNLYDGNAGNDVNNINPLSGIYYVEPGADVAFTVSRYANADEAYRRIRLNANVSLWGESGAALQLTNKVPTANANQKGYAPNASTFTYTAKDVSAAKPVEYRLQPWKEDSVWITGAPATQTQWNMNVTVETGKRYFSSVAAMRDALVTNDATTETLVYRLKKDTAPQLVQELTTCNIRPESVSGTGWSVNLENLPTYQRTSMTNNGVTTYSYKVYSYEIEEIQVNGKTVTSGKTDEYDVSCESSSSTDDDGKVTTTAEITNTEMSVSVKLLKTDDEENSTNYLSGAVFELWYKQKEQDSWVLAPKETITQLDAQSRFTIPGNEEGITLTGLTAGYYKLVEKIAPAGYVITNETPVLFEVKRGEIAGTTGSLDAVRYTPAQNASGTAAATPDTFIIPNTSGAALPSTGGPGTTMLYLFGLLLAGFAGAGLVLKGRCRRNA